MTCTQLAAAALILYPTWYDPYRDRLCEVEDVIGALEAQARAWRQDRAGHVAVGMRAWKRRHMVQSFGRLRFEEDPVKAAADGRPVMVWAGRATPALRGACATANRPLHLVEDGFLRSRGLGADLVPPLSLVLDDLGIYYDPTHESRLDRLITEAAGLDPKRLYRAERLVARLVALGLTKYNLGGALPDLAPPEGRVLILVPGQVEDDASIKLGAGAVRTNAGLLQAARDLHPEVGSSTSRILMWWRACARARWRPGGWRMPLSPMWILPRCCRWLRPCGHDDLGHGVRGAVARGASHGAGRALLRRVGADPRPWACARASPRAAQFSRAGPCGADRLSALS